MAKAGRKSKYSMELATKICAYIEIGTPFEHAARACGLGVSTFERWRAKYPDFEAAIKKAESMAIVRDLNGLNLAAEKTWQVRAWRLERRFPDQFGRHDRTSVDAAGSLLDMIRKASNGTPEKDEKA